MEIIELTLMALVPDDEEDIPAYIWEMGRVFAGDERFRSG